MIYDLSLNSLIGKDAALLNRCFYTFIGSVPIDMERVEVYSYGGFQLETQPTTTFYKCFKAV